MIRPTTERISVNAPGDASRVALNGAQTSSTSTNNNRGSAKPVRALVEPGAIQPSAYFGFKYSIERIIAALLSVPALPVVFVLSCLVRATSRGPAIYKQKRVGLNGRVYSIYKIRTMKLDAESNSGPQWSTSNDPRVTRLGRVLRLLHLDELPQLANVVMGDMTIIGPRPERPEIVKVLMDQVDHYADRLVVKPGITGLAQIYLPPDETVNCVRKKVCVDRAYVNAASPLVDLQIWLCTIVRILGLRKGRGPKWFGLDRRFIGVVNHCCMTFKEPERLQDEQLLINRNGIPKPNGDWINEPQNGHSRLDSPHSINGSSIGSNRNGRPEQPR